MTLLEVLLPLLFVIGTVLATAQGFERLTKPQKAHRAGLGAGLVLAFLLADAAWVRVTALEAEATREHACGSVVTMHADGTTEEDKRDSASIDCRVQRLEGWKQWQDDREASAKQDAERAKASEVCTTSPNQYLEERRVWDVIHGTTLYCHDARLIRTRAEPLLLRVRRDDHRAPGSAAAVSEPHVHIVAFTKLEVRERPDGTFDVSMVSPQEAEGTLTLRPDYYDEVLRLGSFSVAAYPGRGYVHFPCVYRRSWLPSRSSECNAPTFVECFS